MVSGPRYKSGKITIDTSGPSAESSTAMQRLDRIGQNYEKLEEILDELELRIAMDDRLGQEADPDEKIQSPAYRPRHPR